MVKLKLLVVLLVIVALSGCMEDVIRVVDTYPITYLNASNITVTGAANVSGSLINLSDINQGYYNVSEGNAQPFSVTVNFTNITNFSFLEVKSKYFSSSGTPSSHIVDLEILCYTDMEYEDLFFLENAAEWRYFTRHFPDSTHFIDAQGNVSIKFNHTANGNVNHRLWIDTVRLVIKETFEQNTVTLNQYFNTTTTTGGGGVSFDGNPVNGNGSILYNISINHSNLTNLDYFNSSHTNFAASIQGTNYYLETSGNDSNNCLSVSSACLTVTRIFNILKNQSILYGNISVYMGNGTFYEIFTVPELFYDGYKVTIYGTLKDTNLSLATSGADTAFGSSGRYGYVVNTSASWTTDAYKNKLLMNPSGQMAVISGNNATAINYTIQSDYFTKFSSGQPIIIKDWNTTIECNAYLTTSFTGCATLSSRSEFVINSLKIKDNTTTGNGAAVIGDGQVTFNPKYSYLEGYGNGGTVYLTTSSYMNVYNSVFVGDGAVIRLEGSSRIFDRFSSSNYILNGTANSYKTAMLISSGSTGYLGEGYYIDGKTSPAGSKGVWSLDGSAMLVFQGFITNWNYGTYAQRNSLITEAGLPKYITVGVNYYPSIKSDNSSVQ